MQAGKIALQVGASTGYAGVGGNAYTNAADINDTVGGGTEVDFGSYTIPANAFSVVGSRVSFYAAGIMKGRSIAQQLQVKFNGTQIATHSATLGVDAYWIITGNLVCETTGASGVIKYGVVIQFSNTGLSYTWSGSLSSLDLTATKVIKVTNTTTSTGTTPYSTEYLFLADFIRPS